MADITLFISWKCSSGAILCIFPLNLYSTELLLTSDNIYKSLSLIDSGITHLPSPLLNLIKLEETIYENRFQNVPYLNEMGANIEIKDKTIYVKGKTKLKGTKVQATDLRAGACMVLAALTAEGETTITEIKHVLRGYENIIEKLENVGAKIRLEEI